MNNGCLTDETKLGVGTDLGTPLWPTDTGSLCGGYLAYHATTVSGGHSLEWGFEPDFVGTCAIDVYIPDSPHASAPLAHYVVVDQPTHDNPPVTGFKITQAIHHGQWVAVGDYHMTGYFVVRLDDRGDGHSEIVADAVRVNCHRT
ncbi:MAG TPA: hypothetical protein VFX70_17755 [Mycobacteriales bacterium]|nr:hypothetical protein [Mycobacteriales bacterium]